MNVKLHTPKTLKAGSGMSSMKQFLLSLLATTVSIALTFGTAAVVDYYKKKAAKKEMVMMVISDFDKTIDNVMKADTALREACRLELELANHPEEYNSKRYSFPSLWSSVIEMEFPETTQKVFSSSIETFNTIGNANFVNEVSTFYINRDKYKTYVIEQLKNDVTNNNTLSSLKSLLNISFPEYVLVNWTMLQELKDSRDKCMQIMHVSEEDLQAFSKQQQVSSTKDPEAIAERQKMIDEFSTTLTKIEEAKDKIKD